MAALILSAIATSSPAAPNRPGGFEQSLLHGEFAQSLLHIYNKQDTKKWGSMRTGAARYCSTYHTWCNSCDHPLFYHMVQAAFATSTTSAATLFVVGANNGRELYELARHAWYDGSRLRIFAWELEPPVFSLARRLISGVDLGTGVEGEKFYAEWLQLTRKVANGSTVLEGPVTGSDEMHGSVAKLPKNITLINEGISDQRGQVDVAQIFSQTSGIYNAGNFSKAYNTPLLSTGPTSKVRLNTCASSTRQAL